MSINTAIGNFFYAREQRAQDLAQAKSIIANAKKYRNPEQVIFIALQNQGIHPDVRQHLIKHSKIAQGIIAEIKTQRDDIQARQKALIQLKDTNPVHVRSKQVSISTRLPELASLVNKNSWVNFDFKLSNSVTKVLEFGTGRTPATRELPDIDDIDDVDKD